MEFEPVKPSLFTRHNYVKNRQPTYLCINAIVKQINEIVWLHISEESFYLAFYFKFFPEWQLEQV